MVGVLMLPETIHRRLELQSRTCPDRGSGSMVFSASSTVQSFGKGPTRRSPRTKVPLHREVLRTLWTVSHSKGSRISFEPACCTEEEKAKEPPFPGVDQATRTEFGRPRSSIRLRTWAAMATSVARASSLWKRSPSPMTCFQRANWPSTRALSIIAAVALPGHSPFPGDRLDVAVALGGSVSAVALSTASARGGTTSPSQLDGARPGRCTRRFGHSRHRPGRPPPARRSGRAGARPGRRHRCRGRSGWRRRSGRSPRQSRYAACATSAACWCRASPLARPAQLQPRAVDQQVDAGRAGLCRQL